MMPSGRPRPRYTRADGEPVRWGEDDDENDSEEYYDEDDDDDDEDEEEQDALPPLVWRPKPLVHELADEIKMRTRPTQIVFQQDRSYMVRTGVRQLVNTCHLLRRRELSARGFTMGDRRHVGQRLLPGGTPTLIDRCHGNKAYIGQFSKDGEVFIVGYQARYLRLFDVERNWSRKRDIQLRALRWTVTDTALSPDKRFLVYSSLSPTVHIVNVENELLGGGGGGGGGGRRRSGDTAAATTTTTTTNSSKDMHVPLHFGSDNRRENIFGLWSLEFSQDGKEIIAGSSNCSMHIYDLNAHKATLHVSAHSDHVNSVTFADESSKILFSGSDDGLCKVWDRRCLSCKSKPQGILMGHTEGISFVSSKGDGRYLISNSKDQTLKLWDIRKMYSYEKMQTLPPARLPTFRWDYRWTDYPGQNKDITHPHDCSIMTYRGHSVLRTLIRCYFSPQFSTGQKYIYTGSQDGTVYIYDLVTGLIIKTLKKHTAEVRDCNWHPTQPILASVSWDGTLMRWDLEADYDDEDDRHRHRHRHRRRHGHGHDGDGHVEEEDERISTDDSTQSDGDVYDWTGE